MVVALVLHACSVAPNAYLTKEELPSGDFIATDSRLRVIFNVEQGMFSTTGLVEPQRILCTEPSPDVAATVANSIGAGLSVLQYGAGSLSATQTEGLVQLGERTAAIQLLRDKMYQTCVSYANGAITGTTYSLLMSRLDDSIVTLSLGDKAAGAFGGKLAAIGGKANAEAKATLIGLPSEISKIEDQAKQLSAANKKVDDAEKALQAYKATKPEAEKQEEYKTQVANLEKNVSDAKSERDALLELMRSTAKSASNASSEITNLQAGGGFTAKPEAAVLQQMQADFLQPNVFRDLAFACTVELGQRDASINKDEQKYTEEYKNLIKKFETMNTDAIIASKNRSFLSFGSEKAVKQSARNYVASVLHGRSTGLQEWCRANMDSIIWNEINADERRIERIRINAEIESKKLDTEQQRIKLEADKLKAATSDIESLTKLIDKCQTDFKTDEKKKNACLEKAWGLKPGALAVTASPPRTTPTAIVTASPPRTTPTAVVTPSPPRTTPTRSKK